VLGRVARGKEEPISFAKRQVELDGHVGEQDPADSCPARLNEAQVPGRNPCHERQVELTEVPA
jgi:hypothetical protein